LTDQHYTFGIPGGGFWCVTEEFLSDEQRVIGWLATIAPLWHFVDGWRRARSEVLGRDESLGDALREIAQHPKFRL
jgi:hypothetical protein